jgi:formylglycine-generating enzyme required for sulfatase activity
MSTQEFDELGSLPQVRTLAEKSTSVWQLAPGLKPLPDYELVRPLGEGGFGQVWLARGPGGFEVALKFIRLGGAASRSEMQALEMMKGIRHPHLLTVFGVWEQEGWLIIAMERADRSLLDRLKEAVAQGHPGIPRAELLEYLREAAKGLDHLKKMQIIHRDVKPHNLFLCGGGVKVADYGLAKMLQSTLSTVSTKMTPAYCAPELLEGRPSPWSDQYALAVTYCHLRGGRLPFPGSMLEMLAAHATKPPDLSMIPPEEQVVLSRALAKKPEQRWSSCKEFVEVLAAVAPEEKSLGEKTTKLGGVVKQGLGKAAPAALGFWLVLLALLAGIVGLCVLFLGHPWSGREPSNSPAPAPQAELPRGKPPEPPGKTFTNSVGMTFTLIPAGEFMMGSPPTEAGRDEDEPLHRVWISKPFYLGIYEVTQEQYEKVMGHNPSRFRPGKGGGPQHPVEQVSWEDAQEFLRRLNSREKQLGRVYRLPTEAEWEYACRAGSTTRFQNGDREEELAAVGWYGRNTGRRTQPVGQKPPNAWGLYDMHGNVWEWCADGYRSDFYLLGPVQAPLQREATTHRLLRGGCWADEARKCRAAQRFGVVPTLRDDAAGFRAACVLAGP